MKGRMNDCNSYLLRHGIFGKIGRGLSRLEGSSVTAFWGIFVWIEIR